MKSVAVSGGFDPLHIGHIRLIKEARELGDYLYVILNGDSWLKRKKGRCFMPAEERKEILGAIKYVDLVYVWNSEEDDVCGALDTLRPDIFANGGDRKKDNTPEIKLCKELGIELAWNVGGGKIRSSSELLEKYNET